MAAARIFARWSRQDLADTSAQVRNSFRFTSAVARGLRESAIIALGVVALVMFTALVSYSPDDPGFSFTGNSSVVHNRIGPIGAWLADVLFFLFGRPAYLFPVMLGAACWLLFRRDKTEQTSRLNTALGCRFAP
jgi:DNA segregation ATPase FtsK/SpoIIIE-like protein